jgi:hypothetical protein
MGRDDEGSKTEAIGLPRLAPVQTVEELPALAEPGALCFVKAEEESYVFIDGEWKPRKGLMK